MPARLMVSMACPNPDSWLMAGGVIVASSTRTNGARLAWKS